MGEQKMSFETHFFPFWEQTKKVLRHTNEFNIDSLMETKKMSAVFRNSCLSKSGVIDDAKVSDREWRCCAPCRYIIGCKSSFTCHALLAFWFRSCWVQFKVRSLSFSDNDSVLFGTCNQVQLSSYVSSVFPQSGFRLHSLEKLLFIVVLHTVMAQKSLFRNCPVRWPCKYGATHAHFEQIQTGHLLVVRVVYNIILTFKRHNFTDQLVSWICTS